MMKKISLLVLPVSIFIIILSLKPVTDKNVAISVDKEVQKDLQTDGTKYHNDLRNSINEFSKSSTDSIYKPEFLQNK